MPRIAPQHKWKDAHHVPSERWSDETLVQWGANGVVLGKNSYRTAFFEAFPPSSEDAGGFIRGEGASIADAEADALKKYLAGKSCQHLWGRERYTNGGQLCRHCRAFRSGALRSITKLGAWRRPLKDHEMSLFDMDLENLALPEDSPWRIPPELSPYTRRSCLRYIHFGAENCSRSKEERRAHVAPLLALPLAKDLQT